MNLKRAGLLLILVIMAGYGAFAQTPFPVDTTEFAKNASEVSRVSLDKSMLQMATGFMSSDGEEGRAKGLLSRLDGVYVRDFSYSAAGQYSAAALEAIRKHFEEPGWKEMVSTRSKGPDGDADIYVHTSGGKIDGMFVISAEPDELAFVQIVGTIGPGDLAALSGHFGVPAVKKGKAGEKKGSRP